VTCATSSSLTKRTDGDHLEGRDARVGTPSSTYNHPFPESGLCNDDCIPKHVPLRVATLRRGCQRRRTSYMQRPANPPQRGLRVRAFISRRDLFRSYCFSRSSTLRLDVACLSSVPRWAQFFRPARFNRPLDRLHRRFALGLKNRPVTGGPVWGHHARTRIMVRPFRPLASNDLARVWARNRIRRIRK
jgi:hypothetical protein